MSNAILNAIASEQAKLKRQTDLHEETKVIAEILGEDTKTVNKLARQAASIEKTKENIKKLNAAAGKRKK